MEVVEAALRATKNYNDGFIYGVHNNIVQIKERIEQSFDFYPSFLTGLCDSKSLKSLEFVISFGPTYGCFVINKILPKSLSLVENLAQSNVFKDKLYCNAYCRQIWRNQKHKFSKKMLKVGQYWRSPTFDAIPDGLQLYSQKLEARKYKCRVTTLYIIWWLSPILGHDMTRELAIQNWKTRLNKIWN